MGTDVNASASSSSSATSGVQQGGVVRNGDFIVGSAKKIPVVIWIVGAGALLALGLVWLVTRD